MANLTKIPAFNGLNKQELYREVNGGEYIKQGMSRKQIYDIEYQLEERIAEGFEAWLAERAIRMETPLGRFYQTLIDVLADAFRFFGMSDNMDRVYDLYDRIARGRTSGDTTIVLKSHYADETKRRLYKTDSGKVILDFGLEDELEERKEIIKAFFKTAQEAFEDGDDPFKYDSVNINNLKKDINSIEDFTAQARDIYLKDPKQFAAAKNIETVADTRVMEKARMDKFFVEQLKPYLALKKDEQVRVNEILMEGDLHGHIEVLGTDGKYHHLDLISNPSMEQQPVLNGRILFIYL
jgi:hypothetical protein